MSICVCLDGVRQTLLFRDVCGHGSLEIERCLGAQSTSDHYTVVFRSSLYLAMEQATTEAHGGSASASHSNSGAVWHGLIKDGLCVKQIAQTPDEERLLLRVGVGAGAHTITTTAAMTSQARIKVKDEDVVLECYRVTQQVLDEARRVRADAIWFNEFRYV